MRLATILGGLAGVLLVVAAQAKPTTFDGGVFQVTLDVTPETWRAVAHAERNFIQFQKADGRGVFGSTAFESFVFVDRLAPAVALDDLPAAFAAHLKAKRGFLHDVVLVDAPRRFRAGQELPSPRPGYRLFRFEMVTKPLTLPAARTRVEDQGLVAILVPAEFEKHRTFFVFTGRQVLSPDLAHRSELGEVDKLVRGFALKTHETPVPPR